MIYESIKQDITHKILGGKLKEHFLQSHISHRLHTTLQYAKTLYLQHIQAFYYYSNNEHLSFQN